MDEDAFKKFYDVTYKKVFRYLYRLTDNRQMAEDILIDTYTEAWKSAGNFRYQSNLTTMDNRDRVLEGNRKNIG